MTSLRERRGLDVNLRSEPQLREYRAIASRIADDAPSRILDWGCGFGQMTRLLLDRGLDVQAFDYAPTLEREGTFPLRHYPEIEAFLSPDPVRLPFGSSEFDAVLGLGVLEHVARPHESLEELKRVLEPEGTLYVYKLPNRYSYLEKLARILGLYYHGELPDDAVYTKRSALALLHGHGFTVREFRRANMLPLTIPGRWTATGADAIWTLNRALSRVPLVNLLSTNLELVAAAPSGGGR
jgi:2-polyprenyl-3-methyl-5-hydroxy-6-metoxy-1,4-benzoquinol methylase